MSTVKISEKLLWTKHMDAIRLKQGENLRPRGNREVMRIDVRADGELYDLIMAEAAEKNVSLGEVLTTLAAEHFNRPELGAVQKEKPGPKPGRKRQLAGTRNGK
jgi:hypothetical protein